MKNKDFKRWKLWFEVEYPREFSVFDDQNLYEIYVSDYKSWWPKMFPNMNKHLV